MNSLFHKICEDQKVHEDFYNSSSKNKFIKKDVLKSVERLSVSLNISSLMNIKIRQSQPIWETNFGKRLMYGSSFTQSHVSLDTEKFLQKAMQENKSNLIELSNNGLKEKKDIFFLNSALQKMGRGDARDKVSSRNLMTRKKRKIKNTKHKLGEWKKENTMESQTNDYDSSGKKTSMVPSTITKTQSITLTEDKENVESSYDKSRVSSLVKNQGLLTDRVKKIIDNVSSENICEHCERSFSHLHELIDHKKKHETEKENCLLCGKMFYKTDFIQHLLTHEGVERFSCKMCKKYFPTLKTYKNHYEEFHLTALKSISQNSEKIRSQWLSRYECVRCKAEFKSKEIHKNHTRIHQKMDLTGAYLLCPKNF